MCLKRTCSRENCSRWIQAVFAYTPSIDFDIQFVGGIRNTIFGGEGLFFATLRGPGRVWIQSLPISRLANRVLEYAKSGWGRKEEGGVLGSLGNQIGRAHV